MTPSFSDLRNAYRVQKEAKRVKKDLRKIHVEAESRGVKVVVSGEQEIISIEFPQDFPHADLPAVLIDCLNRALKKSQVVSSEKMQGLMSEMGVGGV